MFFVLQLTCEVYIGFSFYAAMKMFDGLNKVRRLGKSKKTFKTYLFFQRCAHHLNLFLIDSFISAVLEAFVIAFLTCFYIGFHVNDVAEGLKSNLLTKEFAVIAIAVAIILFLLNCFSFTSVLKEKKQIRLAELCDSTFHHLTLMSQERPVNSVVVSFLETFTVIQKVGWIVMLVLFLFRNIDDSLYVVALKCIECYLLATFYFIGKLHQGVKKVIDDDFT